MVHRRGNFRRTHRPIFRFAAQPIGRADDLTTMHAAAGKQNGPHSGPMVPAAARIEVGRSPKLTHCNHQRLVQHSALKQIFEQSRVGTVEHGTHGGTIIVKPRGQ